MEDQSPPQHYQESTEDVKEDAEKGPGLRKGQPSQPHQVKENLVLGRLGKQDTSIVLGSLYINQNTNF